MSATLYLNLEDDIAKIVTKLKREKATEIVLVSPKKSLLLSDSINLRLLKKQVDMLGKTVSILTMDERGQEYAKAAGFELKHLPRLGRATSFSDIRPTRRLPKTAPVVVAPEVAPEEPKKSRFSLLKRKPVVLEEPAPVVKRTKTVAKPPLRRVLKKKTAAVPVTVTTTAAPAAFATMKELDQVFIDPRDSDDDVEQVAPRTRWYSRRSTTMVVSLVGLALIIVLALVLFILPAADITVYAESQPVARDIDMTMDSKVQQPDATSLAMPAVPVDETPEGNVTLQTTGKKELGSKAEGQVLIYNLTGSPLNLKANTTVLSVNGKNYVFVEDANNIKPTNSATDDKNATVAKVIAEEGGEASNLTAGTRMEISNQVFGSQPQRLFAKTSTALVGGNSRFVSVISIADVENAKSQLKENLLKQTRDKLVQQHLVLPDNAYTITLDGFQPDQPADTESPAVTVTGKLRLTGLAFNESDLKTIIRDRISASLASGRSLQSADLDSVTYKVKNMDIGAGTLALSIHYESSALFALNPSTLAGKIAGKTKQETSELLLSNEGVTKVDIILHPVWQQNTPLFTRKINIKVQQ